MNVRSLPLIFACAVALLGLLPLRAGAAEQRLLRTGDVPPSITLAGMQGSTITIPDDVAGKVAIIHFWADTCGSCREEMPAIESLYNRYKKKGLVVLAINVGQTKMHIKEFVDSLHLTYPVLYGDSMAVTQYQVVGLPRTFILDRSGKIKYKIIGEATEEMLKKLLLFVL